MARPEQYLHSPLSFGLTDEGKPNAEAEARIRRALVFADEKRRDVFVLGGGMSIFARKRGVQTLAHASETYLREQCGWEGAVFNRAPERNTNTVDEVMTLWTNAMLYKSASLGGKPIARPTTSWWHAFRTWWICLIVFRKPVRVHMSRTTLSWRITIREIIFHECPGFLQSCWQAWHKRRIMQKSMGF